MCTANEDPMSKVLVDYLKLNHKPNADLEIQHFAMQLAIVFFKPEYGHRLRNGFSMRPACKTTEMSGTHRTMQMHRVFFSVYMSLCVP